MITIVVVVKAGKEKTARQSLIIVVLRLVKILQLVTICHLEILHFTIALVVLGILAQIAHQLMHAFKVRLVRMEVRVQ